MKKWPIGNIQHLDICTALDQLGQGRKTGPCPSKSLSWHGDYNGYRSRALQGSSSACVVASSTTPPILLSIIRYCVHSVFLCQLYNKLVYLFLSFSNSSACSFSLFKFLITQHLSFRFPAFPWILYWSTLSAQIADSHMLSKPVSFCNRGNNSFFIFGIRPSNKIFLFSSLLYFVISLKISFSC